MGSGSRETPVRGRAGPHGSGARPHWVEPEDWTEDADLHALAEPSTEIMVRAPGQPPRPPAPRSATSVQIVNNPRRPSLIETPELDPDTDGETQTGEHEVRWAPPVAIPQAIPAPDQSPQYLTRRPPPPPPRTPEPAPRASRRPGAPMGVVAALGLTSVALATVGLFAAIVVVWSFVQSGASPMEEPNPLQVIGLAIQERLNRDIEADPAEPAAAEPPSEVAAAPAPAFDEVTLRPAAPVVAPVVAPVIAAAEPAPAAPKPAPAAPKLAPPPTSALTAAGITSSPRSTPSPAPTAARAVQPRPTSRPTARDEENISLDTWLLIVRADADGVLVEIDGRPAGPAPAKTLVAPGKHRLRLWSNGVASDLIVDVKGDPFEVCFDGKGRTIRKVDCK